MDMGHWSLTTKMPLRDEHGVIIGTFGISRDISTLKQAQEALEKAQVLLAAENERKTEELEKARRLQLSMLPKEIPKLPQVEIDAYMKTATFCMGYFPERDLDSVLNKKIEQFPEFRKEYFYSTFFRPPVLK